MDQEVNDMRIMVFGAADSIVPREHRGSGFTVAEDRLSLDENEVTIRTPDGLADGYFVHPTNGAYPGVVLWPDALGLRTSFRQLGKRLASYGYSVLVVNPHYRVTAAPIGVDMEAFNTPAGREKVMGLARAITPEMTMSDASAFAAYLDQQEPVDTERKLGTLGYCMGGAMAIRTAAKLADRVGAVASFHGRLVTREASSPHLLIPNTRSSALIAIAGNDDDNDPAAKLILRESYDKTQASAEIEVYAGTTHGWCVLDAKAYDATQAERAWSRLLVLFTRAL
jgi:carboxymethylenebutenolidase